MKFSFAALAVVIAAALPSARGDETALPPAAQADAAAASKAKAFALRRQADGMKKEAELQFRTEQQACYGRFLVNSCLDDARKKRSAALVAARKQEAEAREIDAGWRRQEAAEREAKRRDEAPRQERERLEQAERNRSAQEEALRRVERRQAEKAARTAAPAPRHDSGTP